MYFTKIKSITIKNNYPVKKGKDPQEHTVYSISSSLGLGDLNDIKGRRKELKQQKRGVGGGC